MNAKENALRIIRFDRPERIVGGPPCYGLSYFGVNHEGFDGSSHDNPVGTTWTDIWGTRWHKEHPGVMGFPRGNPLDEPSKLASYRWPDPDDERLCGRIHKLAADFPGDGRFLAGSHRDTLWEKAYMLVGMENMMTCFFTAPGFAREILERIMDFQLGIARHYLSCRVEMVNMTDDLGTQAGPLLGERIVREFLLPQYRRIFALYRQAGVLVNFHSCGNIEAMLDIFMELGVNVLNPVQATANDLGVVRARTAGRMALLGGISTGLIMQGPPQRIVAEVRRRMWQLGREGGYFCSPDQGLPFPQEHIDALRQAVEQYGQYPLEEPG
jgi:uroporphyrinogen decarboxylase